MTRPSGAVHALVTGASRGIGAAIAAALVEDGFNVTGTATTASGAATIGERLGAPHAGRVLQVQDQESVDALLQDLGDNMPLVLINNAGITRDNLLMRMKNDEWQSVVDANLSGAYRLSKPLLRPMMKARWGRIVNVSSVVARMGNPGQANYAATKAGIEGFSRALAMEVGSRGITVNSVAPGFIATDMTDALSEKQMSALKQRIALDRLGSVQDVAGAVSFLVSDRADYITGETLHVNGGLYTG